MLLERIVPDYAFMTNGRLLQRHCTALEDALSLGIRELATQNFQQMKSCFMCVVCCLFGQLNQNWGAVEDGVLLYLCSYLSLSSTAVGSNCEEGCKWLREKNQTRWYAILNGWCHLLLGASVIKLCFRWEFTFRGNCHCLNMWINQ